MKVEFEFKLMVPLPDIRPHLLRQLICLIYFPVVVPLLVTVGLLLNLIVAMYETFIEIWTDFIFPCWTGIELGKYKKDNKVAE